jgi:hypothetical protein
MTTETPLLTTEQRKRLITRDEKKESELEAYKKRHNDQVVLKKFGDFLDSIPDVLLILEHMPPEKIAKKLRLEHLSSILDLVETLLQRIDPWPVGEHDKGNLWVFKTYGNKFQDSEPGKCGIQTMSRTASREDIEIHERLKSHVDELRHYIDPCIPDPICRDPEYAGSLLGKTRASLKELQTKVGGPWSMSGHNYLDAWVGKEGWVERRPSQVNIEQLKSMRWKPEGLKNCPELPSPPLLAPRNDVPPREGKSFEMRLTSTPPKEEQEERVEGEKGEKP